MTEFDEFAGRYSEDLDQFLARYGTNANAFAAAKAGWLLRESKQLGSAAQLSILDVGCGPGQVTHYVSRLFARVAGTDISSELLREASQKLSGIDFRLIGPGERLPFDNCSFDMTFCACVMHHIDDSDLPNFCAEMARVTKSGGLVINFEHNPINPLTRKLVRDCELDKNVERLITPNYAKRLFLDAGLRPPSLRYISFFPGFLSRIQWLEEYLGWCFLGCQYYVCSRKP